MTATARTSTSDGFLTRQSLRQRIAEVRSGPVLADDYETEIVTSIDRFTALEPEWDDLFSRAARSIHVFQSFAWMKHWLDTYGNDVELAVVTVRQGGRLVCVWPMQLISKAGLCEMRWMGEPVGQYGDAIIDPEAGDPTGILQAVWEAVLRDCRPDVLTLRKVRDDGNVAAFLDDRGARVVERQEAAAINTSSEGGYSAYATTMFNRRDRKEWRRLRRRLDECGEIAMRVIADPVERARIVREAIEQKRAWLDAKSLSSSALFDDRFTAFFEAVVSSDSLDTGSEVHVLTCDDQLVATQISFRCKRRLAVHLIVYNLEFQKTGAGVLHMQDLIERTFADTNIDVVDLLAPMSRYKLDLATDRTGVRDFSYPASWVGRLYVSIWQQRVRPAVVAALPYLPLMLRRLASI